MCDDICVMGDWRILTMFIIAGLFKNCANGPNAADGSFPIPGKPGIIGKPPGI